MLAAYPTEFQGELLPGLSFLAERLEHKRLKKFIVDQMIRVTGLATTDAGHDFRGWHGDWRWVCAEERLDEAGEKRLLAIFRDWPGSVPMRQAVLTALARAGFPRAGVALFLECLGSDDLKLRRGAYGGLKAMFLQSPPPFNPDGTEDERSVEIAAIRLWVAEQSKPRE